MSKKRMYPRNIHVLFTEKQYAYLQTLDISTGEFLRGFVNEQIQEAEERKREERRKAEARVQQQEEERKEQEEAEKLKPSARGLTDKEMSRIRELKEAAYRTGLMKPGALEQGKKRKIKR